MENPLETIIYRGHQIKIYPDEIAENPLTEWDIACQFAFENSHRYSIEGAETFDDPAEFKATLVDDNASHTSNAADERSPKLNYYIEEIEDILSENMRADAPETVETYINHIVDQHLERLGILIIEISIGRYLDGFAYMLPEQVKEFGSEDKAIAYMEATVETVSQWADGEVYGYVIEPTERNRKINCQDSCYGFYGWDYEKSGLLDAAKEAINYEIKSYRQQVKRDHQQRLIIENFMRTAWAH